MMITNIFEDYSVPDIVINTIHFISFYSHSLMRLTLLFCFYRLGNWDIERLSNLSKVKLLISEGASIQTQVCMTWEPELLSSKHFCQSYKYVFMGNIFCWLNSWASSITRFIYFLYFLHISSVRFGP